MEQNAWCPFTCCLPVQGMACKPPFQRADAIARQLLPAELQLHQQHGLWCAGGPCAFDSLKYWNAGERAGDQQISVFTIFVSFCFACNWPGRVAASLIEHARDLQSIVVRCTRSLKQ